MPKTPQAKTAQLSHEQVAEVVNSEGLGYAVQDYLDAEKIQDPKLRELWANAQAALAALENELRPWLD